MPIFFARRQGSVIVPNSQSSAIEMEKLPERVVFRVEAKVPRNGKHHRLVFALFSLTAQALNDGPAPSATAWDAEGVARLVKIATGHVEIFKLRPADAKRYGTDVGITPKSISYDKMDQTQFGQFADAAMHYIRTELCPYIESSPYWPDIAQIIAASMPPEEDAA